MNRWQNLPTIEALADSLTQAYDRTEDVSIHRWRLAVSGLVIVLAVTVLLAIALSTGAADPPQFPRLNLNLLNIDDLTPVHADGDLQLLSLEAAPAEDFTLLIDGFNSTSGSAWGAWIGGSVNPWVLLIHIDGYFSFERLNDSPVWRRFIHIRSAAANRLRIHRQSGVLSVYINEEIAIIDSVEGSRIGLSLYRQPQLSGQRIQVFTS